MVGAAAAPKFVVAQTTIDDLTRVAGNLREVADGPASELSGLLRNLGDKTEELRKFGRPFDAMYPDQRWIRIGGQPLPPDGVAAAEDAARAARLLGDQFAVIADQVPSSHFIHTEAVDTGRMWHRFADNLVGDDSVLVPRVAPGLEELRTQRSLVAVAKQVETLVGSLQAG